MALQSSGAISLSDIQDEFGGSNPISLSEYYRNGSYVTSNNTGVPTSGTIQLDDFYGAVKQFAFTVSSNQQEMNLSTYATSVGWDGSANILMTIASGVYIWSDSISVGGLTIPSSLNSIVTIVNNGYIIGRGGNGGGYDGSPQNGGPALVNNATGVTLTNASGAYIAGGGGGGSGGLSGYGGGGGGAGGGNGGRGRHENGTIYSGGTGGAVGQSGTQAPQDVYSGGDGGRGQGGGTGGGGGAGSSWFEGLRSNGGGGGGRILNGSGGAGGTSDSAGPIGTGGAGGSLGNTGGDGTGTYVGDGGGGWGASGGGSGGSGGAAISGTAIATYTNNGTVYGSVA